MNLAQFKTHIRSISVKELDAYFDELTLKLSRARSPQVKLGYSIALAELVIEKGLRKYSSADDKEMTLDEILAELEL